MAIINGTAGNDTLTSTGPGDVLVGGAGNDTYIVNDPTVQVIENTNGAATIVSSTAGGVQSNGASDNAVLSADGTKLVFTSTATNLVAGVTSGNQEVYVKDMTTGVISLVSSNSSGTAGDAYSFNPQISADGTKVVFTSTSDNLIGSDTNGHNDIFVKDLTTGVTTKISDALLLNGPTNGDSSSPSISGDGSLVVFASQASNISLLDLNGAQDIFIKNTNTGLLSLVLSGNLIGLTANGDSFNPIISKDGSTLAFASKATDLVSGDNNGAQDIFTINLATGHITLVSRSTGGTEGNADSSAPVFSDDGSKIAFLSTSTNLVAGATNTQQSLYVKDLTTGVLTLVSSDAAGNQANGLSFAPAFSHDGTKMVFASYGDNLVAGDTNAQPDIFLKDLVTGAVTLISNDANGVQSNGFSGMPVFSADDSQIIFSTDATNLVPGDNNGTRDIVIKDIVTDNGGIDTVMASVSYSLPANVENLVLTGSADINATGGAGDNLLTGNAGSNILDGGAGNDTLVGGAGNDTYIVDSSGDVVTENPNEGTDTVQSSITYTLTDNVENLVLTGSGDLNGTGNALDNVITGNSGSNTLDGGAGNDTLVGGAGNDTYIVDSSGDVVTENPNEGTDTVQSSINYVLGANVENLTLTGSGNLNGVGNALDNVITGNSGNNVLNGKEGNDTLIGGAGNDIYVVDSTGDVVIENANEGTDTVRSSVTYTLGANLENLILTGSANIDGTGNGGDNVINGNTGDNNLTGGAGNDSIVGAAGNDTLDGGTGNDTLVGGTGDDVYIVDSTGDVVVEAANGGTDTILASVSYSLVANAENLTLTGTGDINATGNTQSNTITGNDGNNTLDGGYGSDSLNGGAGNDSLIGGAGAGNDTLNGGTGDDTMVGGAGNDTYIVDSTGDVVVENPNAGNDTVISSITYSLGANVENLILSGSANINGIGNSLNNVITGNAGNNVLNGGGGNDTLAGGAGNDTYIVDSTGDVVTENLNEGTDTVRSSITYTLGANVENLVLTGTGDLNGTGNALDNVITGNSGSNTLDGGAGNDTLVGGDGNDTYIVDSSADVVTEGINAGTDIVLASANYTLSANVENLTLTGTGDINGVGNALDNVITGNSGNNTLNGSGGNDTLIGGTGDDTYVVDSTGDVVTENLNAGTDTVRSSIDYTLGANVENLTLTGSANLSGTGNELNNYLTGNSGDNTLNGGAGIDTLAGGTGNDTYIVDSNTDTIVENVNSGIDTVQSSVTYYLTANVENLTLTGSDPIFGVGNNLNNLIIGNSADNTLNGNSGIDTMIGGLGNDLYVVDNSADVVTEAINQGFDTVNASASFTLGGTFVEDLNLVGFGNINGSGNYLDNNIRGNAANNVIAGGAGNDTLTGAGGNDSFLFNTPLNGTNNVDLITDFASGDHISLNHVIFSQVGGAGTLDVSMFVAGAGLTSGQTANQHVIYDTNTGKLYYDADGSGSGHSILFAQVGSTAHPTLTFDSINVV